MNAPPLVPRIEGEGWEVWVDEEGILWTRDSQPQHAIAAASRVAAMRKLIQGGTVKAVLVDDRRYGGPDTEAAEAEYRAFLAENPSLPVAVVTTHLETLRMTIDLRRDAGREVRMQVFKSLPAARAWLRQQGV